MQLIKFYSSLSIFDWGGEGKKAHLIVILDIGDFLFATFIGMNVCSLFVVLVLFILSVGHYQHSVHQLFH